MIFQGTAIPNLIIEIAGIILVAFGTYLFPLIAAYIVSLFVAAMVGKSDVQRRWLFGVLTILMGIEAAALIAAQLTGNLVLADSAGRFSYGAASMMGYMVTASFMVIDLIKLLQLGQNITLRQRIAFIVYLSLPLLSIPVRRFWPGVYVVALASCLSMMIMLIVVVDEQSKSLQKQELDNEQLKVDLMLSQIQPHFLFNVLYVIQEICLIDAETASKAISDFSRYLRHNMDSLSINRPIPFGEELEHVRHYVSLQQLRFGDALDVRYELECTDFSLPTLTLQPLVENAIRYGVRKSKDGEGTVIIRTQEFPDRYEVHVIDDVPGFSSRTKALKL